MCERLDAVKKLVKEAIESFDRDVADTRFQEGYLAALEWLKEEINEDE